MGPVAEEWPCSVALQQFAVHVSDQKRHSRPRNELTGFQELLDEEDLVLLTAQHVRVAPEPVARLLPLSLHKEAGIILPRLGFEHLGLTIVHVSQDAPFAALAAAQLGGRLRAVSHACAADPCCCGPCPWNPVDLGASVVVLSGLGLLKTLQAPDALRSFQQLGSYHSTACLRRVSGVSCPVKSKLLGEQRGSGFGDQFGTCSGLAKFEIPRSSTCFLHLNALTHARLRRLSTPRPRKTKKRPKRGLLSFHVRS